MPFAVVQKSLEPPTLQQLQAAFRHVKGLTPLDAHTLGQDAFGILVKNFPLENAQALKAGLWSVGVVTEVVDQSTLPAMPPGKFVTRLECVPEALRVYDPLGRYFPIEWRHVWLVAAGTVRLVDFKGAVKMTTNTAQSAFGPIPFEDRQVSPREELNNHLLLEIILTRGVQRLSTRADQFHFQTLGARRSSNLAENFKLLVQDLLRYAPQAAVNRGAYSLRENAPEIFSYPSKNAFQEEIIWLLWRMRQQEGAAAR